MPKEYEIYDDFNRLAYVRKTLASAKKLNSQCWTIVEKIDGRIRRKWRYESSTRADDPSWDWYPC